ncbi:hypothetical protein Goshw_009973 [Gossypium schwendimanii]|uniref:SHSP domain-containing protein n=1 Tax=Gossypium schwendimanii TaxID=34291 RepID=A0A7J9L222_GOSSC|nr:hypothetical protein [Gossypium schwendimanii]
MEEGKSKRIISRFRKEFPVSEDYQLTQIHAKFYNGILHLVMPKQIPTISAAGDENNDVAKKPEHSINNGRGVWVIGGELRDDLGNRQRTKRSVGGFGYDL